MIRKNVEMVRLFLWKITGNVKNEWERKEKEKKEEKKSWRGISFFFFSFSIRFLSCYSLHFLFIFWFIFLFLLRKFFIIFFHFSSDKYNREKRENIPEQSPYTFGKKTSCWKEKKFSKKCRKKVIKRFFLNNTKNAKEHQKEKKEKKFIKWK